MGKLIAITGGIGSGKSAVCRPLQIWGFPVYDCDSRARRLMDEDPAIHHSLNTLIAPGIVTDGIIDRKRLAAIVFDDPAKLETLNSIVHRHVIDDIKRWRGRHDSSPLLFVETAILLESNLHHVVDEVWVVTASVDTRLSRAMARDGATEDEIRKRMARQREVTSADTGLPTTFIDNNGDKPILPALRQLLALDGITPDDLRLWKN